MSNTLTGPEAPALPQPGVPARYRLMADILHMFVAAMALCMFLFVGTEVPLLFQLSIMALIMVVLLRGGAWLVLATMQISMFFYETRDSIETLELSTLMRAVFCLGMIAYAAGFKTIRRLLRDWLGLLLQMLLTPNEGAPARSQLERLETQQEQLRDWLWLRERSSGLLKRVGRIAIIVLISSIAFLNLPFTVPGVRMWWQRTTEMNFTLWPGPTAFMLALVCLIVVGYGSWRQLNRQQANLYIRTLYVRDHFKELRSILVRRNQLAKPLKVPLKVPPKKAAIVVPGKES